MKLLHFEFVDDDLPIVIFHIISISIFGQFYNIWTFFTAQLSLHLNAFSHFDFSNDLQILNLCVCKPRHH